MMTSSPRSVIIRRCSAQFAWTMTSSPRSIMTKRCSAQSTWMMTLSLRSIMTRRCSMRSPRRLWLLPKSQSWPDGILRSPRRLWRCPPGLLWPDDVFRSLCELLSDFISKVNYDQNFFFPRFTWNTSRVFFVVIGVNYVLVDDFNYDQMTRLSHTVLADKMTPVTIIGTTLSKKIANNFFRILQFYFFIYYR